MIKSVILFALLLLPFATVANPVMPRRGLEARLSVFVHDDDGIPVSNATVTAHFVLRGETGIQTMVRKTDGKGIVKIAGRAISEVILVAECQGYYKSRKEHFFLKGDREYLEDCINTGRWKPWDGEISVLLRKMKCPIPTDRRRNIRTGAIPIEQPLDVDAENGDLVMAGRNGEHSSFQIHFSEYTNLTHTSGIVCRCNNQLTFLFNGDGCGMKTEDYIRTESSFGLPYSFSETGYDKKYEIWDYLNVTDRKRIQKWPDFKNQFISFRFIDKTGRLRYGMIYGLDLTVNGGTFSVEMNYFIGSPEDGLCSEFPLFF